MESLAPVIGEIEERLDALVHAIDLAGKKNELDEVEREMARPGFWDLVDNARSTVRRGAALKSLIASVEEIRRGLQDAGALADLAIEEGDESALAEASRELDRVRKRLEHEEVRTLLSAPEDGRNAYLGIQAGTGGTDACDWAAILLRMYLTWARRAGYDTEVVDRNDAEEAGVKSATVLVSGANAYGYLRGESGVHRLIRISPFDAQHRRQTSFAAVDVLPQYDKAINIEIKDSDLRRETFRSGGAGGQHVNKTESAVRLTHIPTGVVASCQNERSQHQNERTAMELLKAKLMRLEERKREQALQQMYSEKGEIAWGNQIRSYFVHPEQRVKDHRTGIETPDTLGVLDGNIDSFIDEYLRWNLRAKAAKR